MRPACAHGLGRRGQHGLCGTEASTAAADRLPAEQRRRPTCRGRLGAGDARPRLRHTGHMWVSNKGSGIGRPRVQTPASVLCDLEELLGLSVPRMLHPGKVFRTRLPSRGGGRVRGAHTASLRP